MVQSISRLDKNHDGSVDKESSARYTFRGFQLFYLSNDQGQSVEVEETSQIDLKALVSHLRLGESIFIKCMDAQ